MDIDEPDLHEAEQEQSEAVRRFIRHPSDFPITYSLGAESEKQQSMRDVSCGGLCFTSECPISLGKLIHISIPVESTFEADAIVAWCKPEDDHYAIGIEFDNDSTHFAMRMVEQVCHIEHYRKEVQREGRELSSEQAAEECVSKYAATFPRH